ncbi:MAG TPA: dolichyl-phosphate beta-glucosyltransferase [Fimbriimonadaceae bacterium]|nr:dolichyl-phosphate beta-glucosyltransferase [Fimbriimonadaceae bacterium]
MSKPHLAVIVPAYNEEDRIAPTLARLHEYFVAQKYTWKVVVVSDGSRDKTCEIVRAFASGHPGFELIDSQPNHGKGFVVRKGMMETEAEWLLFSDADLAAPIEEVEKLFIAVEKGPPIAIGSRPLKESRLEVRQPWYRELAGRTFNLVVQTLAVKGIKDTQCGFKLFREDVAKDVFPRCKLDGYGFDFEALLIARDLGYEIAEIPIRWAHQEGSKVSMVRDGLRMICELFKLRLAGKRNRLKPRS